METPVGLVDLERVEQNVRKVAAYAQDRGLTWRPHVKTHKSLGIARLQLAAGATGLTTATLREAEVMADVCDDILLAYPPIGPKKLRRLVELAERVHLGVSLDSREALAPLARAAAGAGRRIEILVEVDVGMGRVGVAEPTEAVELAERVGGSEGVAFGGLMFYPGHIRLPIDRQEGALEELSRTLEAHLAAFERAGISVERVSGGSTPTLWESHRVEGVTEIRSGTCVYHDRDMLSLGVADLPEIAYTILATVVSTQVPGQAVVDAGSKALAKEELRAAPEGGYGFVLGQPDVRVARVSEEHGMLELGATDWRPRVGDLVRIVPNHVCVSVNLQDRIVVQRAGGEPEVWQLEGRGRLARSPDPAGAPAAGA